MGKDGTEIEEESLQREEKSTDIEEKFPQRKEGRNNREISSGVKDEKSEKEEKSRRSGRRYPDAKDDLPATLRESGAAPDYYEDPYGLGKLQGEYTVADYYALPEGVHAELIDGWLYDMASPSFRHESIGLQIYKAFDAYIERKGGDCIAMKASMDMQLDQSKKTIVQPDVFILCDQKKRRRSSIFGSPDLIVEILSPSTAIKDKTVKLKKYRESGVREYWIVDPEEKEVLVYRFRSTKFDVLPTRYTFKEKVPVGIFDGECEVDFAEIEKYLMRHQMF